MKRRELLQATALATGGFLLHGAIRPALARSAPERAAQPATTATASTATDEIVLNAWVRIGRDNVTTVILSQAEMGQGVQTTLPAIVADELGADWSLVRSENSPAAPAYRNPRSNSQFTGNAESVRTFHDLLRTMGATAREMLVAAAARKWRVPASSCKAEASTVIHVPTGRSLRFGELAEAAAKMPVPAKPRIKPPAEWTLVGGRSLPRVDIPAKVKGTALFGIDVEVDGMVHAALRLCPTIGGAVTSIDQSSISNMPGVIAVVPVPGGVAVVAESTWQARRAADKLALRFDDGPSARISTATLDELYQRAIDGDQWAPADDEGGAPAAIDEARARGARVLTAEYSSAWQVHAPMEPMNCTALASADRCELWAPTQGQEMVQKKVAEALGIAPDKVIVNRTYLGGGFGRRLIADFAVQAALVSRAVGKPVKVLWSREDDMRHSHYRPRSVHRLTAALDRDGLPAAVAQKLVSPSILSAVIGSGFRFRFPAVEPSLVEGARHMRYGIPKRRLDLHILEVPVPTMVWRTTGYGPNVFAIECFIDELAAAANTDPYAYRRTLLERHGDNQRALAALERAAAEAGWPGDRQAGRSMGMALSHAFDSYIAQVVEISTPAPDIIDIHRVVSAVDLGRVLDPGIARAGIEGGVAWGLTQCLSSEITFERGRVQQSNFHEYRILSLPEMPRTETHFVDSGAPPGGLGELGPITVAPALCNAIFAATGKRYRSLPLSRHGIYTRHAREFITPERSKS